MLSFSSLANEEQRLSTDVDTATSAVQPAVKVSTKIKPYLAAKPQKCVTLNEGRTCYARIELTWKIPSVNIGKFCLVEQESQEKLYCFTHQHRNSIKVEFESNKTRTYQLINAEQKVIAQTHVEVNWVYEASPRKRRWRVF